MRKLIAICIVFYLSGCASQRIEVPEPQGPLTPINIGVPRV